ncbi:phage tail tape measure protein [Pseudomonas monteilii]|uniref:phage tail tape measure protein n=1 Tax=Pseudomonas monteilii TaxID=76759 RepID=UPI001E58ADF1|nr:phage tail tape measure protein [Pseudomonas monteilii]WJO30973.1 phage tail tape measure protein [Pseudomonas monteilii]
MASRSLGTLTLDLIARIGGFQQGMDQAARSTQRSMGQVVRHAESASESVTGSFKAIAAAAAAFLSVQQLVEYSQTWLGVQNRIKQVSETFDEFSKQSSTVFSIAQNSQSSLEATAELYQRIAASSGQLGTSQEKVAQVTQNISKAMSASGVSAEAAQGALVQLGQAFASGVLRGEELNSVLEQAPGLAQAIADGLGVARESLRSMGEAGKLTSKEVFSAILSQTRSIDDAFARSQTSVSGAFQVMENSAAKFFGTLDETLGITKSFVQTALSVSAAWDASGVESFTQVLKTGLYVALARVAAGFVNATGAKYLDIKATQEQLYANSLAAAGELRRAEAVKVGAAADVESAARAVASAKAKVTADRQVITSEIARFESVQAALASEKLLEAQRLQAQISDVGRQQSIARMVELRLTEVAITNQLAAAEAKLATTTLATSAQVTAAINQQTVAKEALAVANTQVNATQIAATASMGAWFSASTAMGASMVALRNAAGGVLRMAAGWPGLILTVGALALSFIDFGDKAEEGAGKAASAFEDASTRIRQASRSMLPENLNTQSYDQLQDRLKGLQAELKEAEKLQEQFQKGVDDKSDVPFETSLDASKEKADALRLAIQSVQKELNSSRLASDKEGNTYLKNLEMQAVVAGKLTEVEKLRAKIAAGSVKFSPDDEAKALAAAAVIDKANKALKESKAGDNDGKALSRRFEDMEEGYKRQIELINTSTDKRKNATEVEKLAFEVSAGKLEGVNAQQHKHLEGLAAELDAKKALLKADQDAKKLAALQFNLSEDNRTAKDGLDQDLAGAGRGEKYRERAREMLSIEQDFNKQRREMYKEYKEAVLAEDPDAEANYKKETELLEEALAERLVYQQDYYNQLDEAQSNWMDGVTSAWEDFADAANDYSAMAADATTSILGSARSELSSFMSDVATSSADAGDALMDMITGFAKSMIGALADMAAQWLVYQAVQLLVGKSTQSVAAMGMVANAQATSFQAQLAAYASTAAIPVIGPALAPGAALTAAMATAPMVAGVASTSLMGMAHNGLDNIPREGTWLLDGGERVLNPNQNRDLTQYLRNANDAGGGGGGGVTINAPVTVQAQPGMSDDAARRQGEMMAQGLKQQMEQVIYEATQQGGLLWRR